MSRDIAAELAAVLEAAGLGLARPPAPGANLFTSPMPEVDGGVPDRAVALVVTGGAGPLPYLGVGRAAYLSPGCQVRIRSAREDFQGGQALALAVFAVLNQTPDVLGVSVRAEESAPVYLGTDGADRHRWVLNVMLKCLASSKGSIVCV
ncbi:minor capsid protein [Myxococcus sp. K38C18041901]|uniref:minor capsid protein n=1 Tax=Myxococcus guangdongensis TaxID=2906760 RepID=UPI0020A764DB|nr:minor capsid protein [Myxococcus guangdongensis]MCP3060972.1 minor capsid protein [Myxococcus guangdongensis]